MNASPDPAEGEAGAVPSAVELAATRDTPLGVTAFECRVLHELYGFADPAPQSKVARRFAAGERALVPGALNALVNSGLCRRYADGRFALSVAGRVSLA